MSAFTEANRKAFDELSATYNSKPWQLTLANQVKEALQARKDWIAADWVKTEDEETGREVKLLDFASGTGNCSNALESYVTKIRGIDISPNMVKEYNAAAGTSGAYAIEGDLFAAEGVPEQFQTPEFSEFDVAVVGLGFHHFENPKLALERLAGRLKGVTGVLVIVDFLPFKHVHSHGGAAAATIKHHGFTPEDMRDLYTAAGFVDFDIVALKKPAVMEMKDGTISERTIFLAKGRKSGTVLQRLGAWLGSAQGVVGGQMQVDRRDPKWNPGAGNDASAKGWDMVGRRKGDEWDGYENEDRTEKKAWNGF